MVFWSDSDVCNVVVVHYLDCTEEIPVSLVFELVVNADVFFIGVAG